MIQAIVFDCFGVLTKDLWHEFTVSLPADQARKARDLNSAYDSGFISKEQFLHEVHAVTGREPHMVEELLDTSAAKNMELLDYIAGLKQQYKIGLLSNIATNWIRESFLTPDEQQLFDTMVFSFEEKMAKPDPRIFQLACDRLGVETSSAVMIDDIERYCMAARDTGMQAVQYTDFVSTKRQLDEILANSNH